MSTEGSSILARTARGAGWVVAWRMATRILGLASTLILVRLMAPDEFGLVALAAAFVTTLDVLLGIGVEEQIVRAEKPSRELYDTAFTINLLRGLLIAAVVIAGAAPAAAFFNEPRLMPVLIALAFSALLSGFSSIGVVDFRRNLQFDREFLLNLVPRVCGIVVTVSLAFVLQSHWALVAGILTGRIGNLVMGYAMHPYRPRLSLAAWRELAGVSAWTWALSVISIVRDRTDSFVIGRQLGTASVGYYGAGMELATLPNSELIDPICRACMSGFAESRRAGENSGGSYLRIIALLALLTVPAGLGLSLVASPLVALAYGQQWLDMVPVVTLIGAASMFMVFGTVSYAMLNAHARLSTMVAIALFTCVLRIGLLLVLTPLYGLVGASLAVITTVLIEGVLLTGSASRLLRIRPGRLFVPLWRPAIAAAVMALVLWGAGLGWAPPPSNAADAAQALFLGVLIGFVTYVSTVLLLWLVSGRPEGGETDLLMLARRTIGDRVVAWMRPRRLAGQGR